MGLLGNLIGVIALVCFIWVVYDVWANQKGMSTEKKVLWSVLAFFFSIITAIVYYLMNKK